MIANLREYKEKIFDAYQTIYQYTNKNRKQIKYDYTLRDIIIEQYPDIENGLLEKKIKENKKN
jgi:hypothetical protein